MIALIYNNKIIFTHEKRSSRLFLNHTFYNEIIYIKPNNKFESYHKIKQKSIDKKIYCINRHPIGHISSGLYNHLSWCYVDKYRRLFNYIKEYDNKSNKDYLYKLLFYTIHPYKLLQEGRRKGTKIYNIPEIIPIEELVNIFNFHVVLFNTQHKYFEYIFKADPHINPHQNKIIECLDMFDCELVYMEDTPNILSYLGFNYSDKENNTLKNKFSQKNPKQFYNIFLDYILTQSVDNVVAGFKKIYGDSINIDKSKIEHIIKHKPIIKHINNEISLYNTINQK
jgi:hypothetical protein